MASPSMGSSFHSQHIKIKCIQIRGSSQQGVSSHVANSFFVKTEKVLPENVTSELNRIFSSLDDHHAGLNFRGETRSSKKKKNKRNMTDGSCVMVLTQVSCVDISRKVSLSYGLGCQQQQRLLLRRLLRLLLPAGGKERGGV